MKSIMYNQSVDGCFAYLGPKDVSERYQAKLFDIHDTEILKRLLVERFKGQNLSYEQILERMCIPWHTEPPYIDKHYRQALKELERERGIYVERVTSKTTRGLRGKDKVTFPKSSPVQTLLPIVAAETVPKVKIHYKAYQLLDGTKRNLVWKVNDGSIITRFDKTPVAREKTDIVCPHFLELKWAYGCPFDCAWCYLKGTFRFRPEGPSPVVKPRDKTELHVRSFLESAKDPEILNTGEIADSLMNEDAEIPFSKFVIPLFETQRLHKVSLLTKSPNIKNLLEIDSHDQSIVSFSLNAIPICEKWEKAPHVLRRIEAAKELSEAGYEVRVRIDPMVPVENWREHYLELLGIVFDKFIPERITLGSLRGLQSTINGCTDKTWVRYLKESSNWGKKIDLGTRYAMYSGMIQELQTVYGFTKTALCKETIQMWNALGMDYKKIGCNCIW